MKRLLAELTLLILVLAACSPSTPPQPPVENLTATPVIEPTAQPQPTAAPTALTAAALRNATLVITGSDNLVRIMTFKDGHYQQGTDQSQTGYADVSMGDKIGFGDLNGDGLQDAVISIGENYGGSGVFVSLVAILNENGQPKPAASVVIEDRAMVNTLTIENGEILADATVHGPNDPMCCPSLPTRRAYTLAGQTLELARLSTITPAGAERLIQVSAPANGAQVSGTFTIQGNFSISPFENTLSCKIFKQGSSEPLDHFGFTVNAAEMGGPGTFQLDIDPAQKGLSGPLRIEIADLSAADGSIIALASLYVTIK